MNFLIFTILCEEIIHSQNFPNVQVLHEELRGIREACTKIDQNFKPKITFIVCQKRHHTRLFPGNPSDGCGKHKNVFPGSVVDTEIVHQDDFNFYLCSHAGIQVTIY